MSQFKKAIGEGPYKCVELGKLLLNEKLKAKYQFMSEDDFRKLLENNMQEAMRVYWLELFYRSHMGAFSGLKRFLSWVDIVENSEHNYISYCSGLRGLMESCGDTYHGLSQLAVALGDNKAVIKEALAGKATSMTVNSEFEDLIIHFTHASKSYSKLTKKKEHKPKDAKEYVSLLENGSNVKFYDYYGLLCEVTHPASDSLGIILRRRTMY